ncbi:MAG TPA: peptide chain release factor 2 [Myxococcota bacterium]|nr:peptide chain release factor 2 [Myxococcota bacterium]
MTDKDSANLIYENQRLLASIGQRLESLRSAVNVDEKARRLDLLEQKIAEPGFWEDAKQASMVQKEKALLKRELDRFNEAESNYQDYLELVDLIKDDVDAIFDLDRDVAKLDALVKAMETECMLNEEHDQNNAILSINVGQGGVDSQDFSEMLLRMYRRYAERKGFEVTVMDWQPGEEAGIKSATVLVSGPYAYGYLKAEIGVHRLVRISPFDSGARRHTSFASVWVIPEIDDTIEVDIKPDDLRIDTFRSGGAGGQHVNKTDSAVRITHLPTNTVVVCQAERSQIKNRATAMKLLKARLYELEMRKRLLERDKAEAQKLEASFGSQIRNYVLAPYRLVKDLRTGLEVGNVDAVLDGDIQPFIDAYLLQKQQH